jgi:hypothetical protein
MARFDPRTNAERQADAQRARMQRHINQEG